MRYAKIPPPDYLKDYVRFFWTLEHHGTGDIPLRTFRTIPDGCPGLIFQQPAAGGLHDENHDKLPDIFLYGQATRPRILHSCGNFGSIGVFFYPNAVKAVFGLNAHEITDDCIDLVAFSNRQGVSLYAQIAEAKGAAEQVAILSSYLFSRILDNKAIADPGMKHAVHQIVQSKGSVSLKFLQEQLFLTERSFERKFKQWVGISPKLFARICRFQSSLQQLRQRDFSKLSDIAYEHDYADHSHYIRAFKEFAGASPNQFRKHSTEVVDNLAEVLG
ncbi:helix-turn-helix transcriptional regulator [uncultured Chitinophaga sp.]|jgi:AraC-type DNA-binding domain-containing proteins|uniref:helix-turn-helix transcriptional regulator n=1 Tax=uncultured Chitinophaga sp. TaxID=339340 RepID=UPI00260FFEB9|nr:helix-turn-helix transcriptional regulator [uncultured Chitinophaga sp.]